MWLMELFLDFTGLFEGPSVSHSTLFQNVVLLPLYENTSTLVSAVTQLKMKLLNRNIQRLFNSIS